MSDIQPLINMAEEIGELERLADRNADLPVSHLIRHTAHMFRLLLDDFSAEDGAMSGPMPWWPDFPLK